MDFDPQFENKVGELWSIGEGQPCPECKELLLKFAKARPKDFEFLTTGDMVDPSQDAFAGIPEWDVFIARFSSCDLCTA